VASQKVAGHLDAADHRFSEPTGPEFASHCRGDFFPVVCAEFLMNALVADDRKLLGTWREIEQDGVTILSGAHAELFKTAGRAIDDRISVDVASGDKHADLPGRPAFRLLNGLNDRSLVELAEEVVSSHCCSTICRSPLRHRSCPRHR
jgi:hypothetical protein